MTKIRKAVFPVSSFGIRCFLATKVVPREFLPIVFKVLVQSANEEAIAAGVGTLIFVPGRNKREIECSKIRALDLCCEKCKLA